MATVLLVEDEPVLLELIAEALVKAGHTVYPAVSREAAIHLCQMPDCKIDFLVCDVLIGRANGFEIAANLKAAQPDARVILMSGSPRDKFSLAEIAHEFLQKPFALFDLLNLIAQQIEAGKMHEIRG